MTSNEYILIDLFLYFGSTALLIPLFKSIGLNSLFGYIASGIILGPQATGLLHHAKSIHSISEIGIILLLFVIGLELSPARLNHLKKSILQFGVSQYLLTSVIFAAGFKLFSSFNNVEIFVLANALSLSSTAIGLSYLRETDQLTKSYGQAAFGVLIFQDLIIIPVLSIIPLLAPKTSSDSVLSFMSILKTVGFMIVFVGGARFVLEKVVNFVSSFKDREVFIGFCLMVVFGASILTETFGLSKALGAFIAGIALSGSEFKSEIQKFSLPLKSTLMGVFFMGIGLSFDLSYFANNILTVSLYSVCLMCVKFAIMFTVGRFFIKEAISSTRLSMILCQGGEFAFLMLAPSLSGSILDSATTSMMLSVITFSMLLTPVLLSVSFKLLDQYNLSKQVPNNVVDIASVQSETITEEVKEAA